MSLPNPIVEREARSGQEGFVHYLFTCLLLGGRPPGENRPARLSEGGLELLSAIDALCFDDHPAGGGAANASGNYSTEVPAPRRRVD